MITDFTHDTLINFKYIFLVYFIFQQKASNNNDANSILIQQLFA